MQNIKNSIFNTIYIRHFNNSPSITFHNENGKCKSKKLNCAVRIWNFYWMQKWQKKIWHKCRCIGQPSSLTTTVEMSHSHIRTTNVIHSKSNRIVFFFFFLILFVLVWWANTNRTTPNRFYLAKCINVHKFENQIRIEMRNFKFDDVFCE